MANGGSGDPPRPLITAEVWEAMNSAEDFVDGGFIIDGELHFALMMAVEGAPATVEMRVYREEAIPPELPMLRFTAEDWERIAGGELHSCSAINRGGSMLGIEIHNGNEPRVVDLL